MDDTLRVLLHSPVNPADDGGVQAVFRRLCDHLQQQGHSVVRAWTAPHRPEAPDPAVDLPMLVVRHRLPAPRSAAGVARACVRLGRHLARWRPQVVNVHFVTAEALYFLLLKPLFGYRVVLSAHGSDILRPKPWNAPWLPRLLPRADAITAVSQPTAAWIRACPGVDAARVTVIPNGIPFDFWSTPPAGVDTPLARRPPVVVSIGRLHPVKGQDVLLHAFRCVHARQPEARLVLVGEGGQREAYERLAGELGLNGAVEFTGQLGAGEVRALLARARVFALPSRSEGLPLALLEAMAAGVPIVASRVGGVPDVVAPGTGALVPPEAPEALASAIGTLLADPGAAAAMQARARERARLFSAIDADRRYEQLLFETARA